jgi:hypothetical protein
VARSVHDSCCSPGIQMFHLVANSPKTSILDYSPRVIGELSGHPILQRSEEII